MCLVRQHSASFETLGNACARQQGRNEARSASSKESPLQYRGGMQQQCLGPQGGRKTPSGDDSWEHSSPFYYCLNYYHHACIIPILHSLQNSDYNYNSIVINRKSTVVYIMGQCFLWPRFAMHVYVILHNVIVLLFCECGYLFPFHWIYTLTWKLTVTVCMCVFACCQMCYGGTKQQRKKQAFQLEADN